ncbi:restriction endonuclease subunit S [Acinetobacter sp. TR11]|uniref:restriction endonuclease subunit S n=1 Tax=Acinetobacter sp. TR11 TaxID=3003393 RepID=UPI0022AC18C5|nr:restriction endonuclease subunit S [Acinetobacter sp. TR11]WAU72346.1 restriction endonuclease subunit S [Acinetobacter sp. TR11]
MAKYQAYTEYKDSCLEWLGEIPSHWKVKKLKYLGEAIIGLTYSPDDVVDEGEGTLVLRSSNIQNKKLAFEDNVYVRKEIPEKLRTQKNDILICARNGSRALIGKNALIDESAEGVSFGAFMSIFRSEYNSYLSRVFNSALFEYQSGTFLTATINQLTTGNLNSFEVPLPPLTERNQISNFLDYETRKIDHLIEKQQQLIELLKEKRQAVISHAVTKGLDPNVPMKDSGVEWLGEVPEHWDVIAISKVTQKITNGYVGPTRDILVEEGIPYVQATHIKKGKVNFDNAYFVREKWSNDHAKSILKKDDVLIVQTGAGTGDVGLVSESEEGFNCHALIILQPKKQQLSGSYLAYCLQSDYGYATLYSIRTGGMHPHLNCGEVQFVKISVPPLDEQVAISKFIEKNIQDFDQLIEKAKLAIQLMQERRTALISAAVTGKIDVRHWQEPTVAEAHTELSA